jgi:hypothetical protein
MFWLGWLSILGLPFFMTFEQQILKLSEEAVTCGSDEEAIQLTQRLQVLMHSRVEEVRGNLITLQPIGPTGI